MAEKKLKNLKKRKPAWRKMPFWLPFFLLVLCGGLWVSYYYLADQQTKAAQLNYLPRNFQVRSEDQRVILSWQAPTNSDRLVNYRLERSQTGPRGDYSKWIKVTTQTSLVDQNVSSGRIYWYCLFAVYPDGLSQAIGPIAIVPGYY